MRPSQWGHLYDPRYHLIRQLDYKIPVCSTVCPSAIFEYIPRSSRLKKSMEKIESLVRKRTGFGKSIDPPGPQHSNRELDFCLLPGSHANVMRLWRFLKAQLNIWAARYSALSPCRFDHNLWQMVNTAEAIRKSLSSLMEERVSALINIRPCSTFSHCKSSLVDLERVSTVGTGRSPSYQHRLKARDRLMCYRA